MKSQFRPTEPVPAAGLTMKAIFRVFPSPGEKERRLRHEAFFSHTLFAAAHQGFLSPIVDGEPAGEYLQAGGCPMTMTPIFLLVSLAALSACAGPSGTLDPDAGAAAAFEEFTVLPDHAYYFSGPEGRPDAVIAVHSDYRLASDQWTPAEVDSRQLRRWVDHFDSAFGMDPRYDPSGAVILGPAGERIGLWYSPWRWTVIEVKEDRRVVVYPPDRQEDSVFEREDRFPGRRH